MKFFEEDYFSSRRATLSCVKGVRSTLSPRSLRCVPAALPIFTRIGTGSANAAELMRFYWDTIARCVPPETVLASLGRAGFVAPDRVVAHGIFSEYTATRRA